MAKFVFRLAGLLSLKEKIEKRRENEYGAALAALEREREKLAELENELAQTVEELREFVQKSARSDTIAQYNAYIELVKKRIKAQIKAIQDAEEFAEQARLTLVEAMKERKTLETLKEKDFESYKEEEKRLEQKVLDEVVSYKYSTRD